jgi:hypothetical protein
MATVQGIIKVVNDKYFNGIIMWKEIIFILTIFVLVFYAIVNCKIYKSNIVAIYFLSIIFPLCINIFINLNNVNIKQMLWGAKPFYFYSLIIFFIVVLSQKERRQILKNIIEKLIYISLPIHLIGILQLIVGKEFFYQRYSEYVKVSSINGIFRIFSTFTEPFAYGSFCVMMIFFILSRRKYYNKKGLNLTVILSIIGIFLSTSREAILAFTFGLILYFVLINIKKFRYKYLFISIGFIIPIIMIFSIVAIAYQNINIFLDHKIVSSFSSSSSVQERFQIWKQAFNYNKMENIANILIGKGIGTIGAGQSRFASTSNPGDNIYIQLLVNQGLIGLVGFLMFNFYVLTNKIKAIITDSHEWIDIGFVIWISGLLVGGFFRSFLDGFPTHLYYWVFIALIA